VPVIVAKPAPAAPVADPRLLTALTAVERFDPRAPFWRRSATWAASADGGGVFWFVGELGLETRLKPEWKDGVKAEIEVLAADRSQIMTESVELTSDAAFLLRVPKEGELPPGNYSVRVRLRPGADVPPLQDALRVSVNEAGAPFGEPVYWRRGPSVRMPYIETADPRFRRTEALRIELPIPPAGDLPAARLLTRGGNVLVAPFEISERTDGSGGSRWMVIDAALTSLAPGDYVVEVTQNGASRVTAFRLIP
jgi:hypothetical protein